MNGINIRKKILRWMDLVIIDPINKDHFLFYDKSRLFNDNKNLFMSDLRSNLPSTKKIASKSDIITSKIKR